jgi:hypothetical protein
MLINLDMPIDQVFSQIIKLDIKLINNNDSELLREREELFEKIKEYFNDQKIKYLYDCLLHINILIFNKENLIKINKNIDLFLEILDDKNMCERIKYKIKNYFNPNLKKEYNKKCFIIPHPGIGDQITIMGAIRELSYRYDKVIVFCKNSQYKNVQELYNDDKDIEIISYIADGINCNEHNDIINEYKKNFFDIYLCMFFKNGLESKPIKNIKRHDELYLKFWYNFYCDIGLDYTDRYIYSYIPITENQNTLYDQISTWKGERKKYIFVHDTIDQYCQISKLKNILCDEDIVIFSVNENYYNDTHKYFSYWKKYDNSIWDFKKVIENAYALYLVDSSFFCFASLLNLSHIKNKFVQQRDQRYLIHGYGRDAWTIL